MRGGIQLAALALLLSAQWATAQQNAPHIGYVYPAGGRQGTSFEATVGGQSLNGVRGALVTGDGVHVTLLESIRPLQQSQIGTWRDRLKVLNDKKHAAKTAPATAAAPTDLWTDADEHEAHEIRLMLAQYQKRSQNVAIAERARLLVTVDANATPGKHELRLDTPNGVTNPIYFYVGRLSEWDKPAAGTVTDDEVNEQGNLRKRQENPEPTPVVDVTAPVIVNGQIAPGGVDRYRFTAHKGERLVAAVSARQLIPYIADAVPGWFQATLTLYDASGKQLKYVDHTGVQPDPVLLYEIPADGQYTIAIHDSIYRGREDFVYRMELGDLPYVSSIFPLGGSAGQKTHVELSGWNLAQTRITQQSRDRSSSVQMLSVGEEEFNARPFAFDTLPESLARKAIDTPQRAQKISLPTIVNGRIEQKNECEFFQIKGKSAESIEAEVDARRLDSPLDSLLTLSDARGRQIASSEAIPDEVTGLITDQSDALLRASLPADGTYTLRLCDRQRNGGTDFAYRLRVSHPQPDFELQAVLSSAAAKAGANLPITINVLRRGGFTGDIALQLLNPPAGFQLNGAIIAGNQSLQRITLRLPNNAQQQLYHLTLVGSAIIAGHPVQRTALAADDWTQAFLYHHLVATSDLLLTVNGRQPQQLKWSIPEDRPLSLSPGHSIAVSFELPPKLTNPVQLSLVDPPDGISIEKTVPYAGGITAYIRADGVKAKSGLRGNLILTAAIDRSAPPTATAPKPKPNLLIEQLPAFPFAVAAAQTNAVNTASALSPPR
jgi:hypothetical protein